MKWNEQFGIEPRTGYYHGTQKSYLEYLEQEADTRYVHGRGCEQRSADTSFLWDGRLQSTMLILSWESLLNQWGV
jgi:hypothetical protein